MNPVCIPEPDALTVIMGAIGICVAAMAVAVAVRILWGLICWLVAGMTRDWKERNEL